jgi:hypothetical protein
MNALVADLSWAVPKERRPALELWDARLKAIIARSFVDGDERLEASKQDRQGLGAPRQHASVDGAITTNEGVTHKRASG